MANSSSSLSGGFAHKVSNVWQKFRESVKGVPTTSQFKDNRTLTPAEFMRAGDYLVMRFPSWEWCGGLKEKRKNYLGGKEKQCLVMRKVPSNPIEHVKGEASEQEEGGEVWVLPGKIARRTMPRNGSNLDAIREEIGDMSDEDAGALPAEPSGRRLYDLYITYDIVFKVPRVWLVGYNSDGGLLTAEQMRADLSPEHAGMTITWDPHPHEDFHALSIHPCRHALVMKELLDAMEENGRTVPIDQ